MGLSICLRALVYEASLSHGRLSGFKHLVGAGCILALPATHAFCLPTEPDYIHASLVIFLLASYACHLCLPVGC